MLPPPSRPPPKRAKPLKFADMHARSPRQAVSERAAKARTRLHVDGVARALDLTEAQVRTRVQRKQWDLIPEPEATRERTGVGGRGRYFWYADKVAAFKLIA
jgi:hypothetical protein